MKASSRGTASSASSLSGHHGHETNTPPTSSQGSDILLSDRAARAHKAVKESMRAERLKDRVTKPKDAARTDDLQERERITAEQEDRIRLATVVARKRKAIANRRAQQEALKDKASP